MKTFINFLLILCATLLSACESMVTGVPESKLPQTESKLVVQSFISPQAEYINVLVSESFPLFQKSDASIESLAGANVTISDGTHEMAIPYNETTKTYTLESKKFEIHAGATYYLRVSDGERTVKAQCTVPTSAPVIKSYRVTPPEAMSQDLGGLGLVKLDMNWEDIPGEKNYYRTNAYMTLEHSIGDGIVNGKEIEKRITSRISFYWSRQSVNKPLQHDDGLDGNKFFSPTGEVIIPTPLNYSNGTKSQVDPNPRLISITMELFNTDQNYYEYHHSLMERQDYEDPFKEPYLIYSNIEGGLGCFGAYNTGKLVYRPE